MSCFRKLCCCLLIMLLVAMPAISLAGDIIKNGGFEQIDKDSQPKAWQLDSWKKEGVYLESDPNGKEGKCLHLVVETENDARAIQTVKVDSKSYYKISCFVKVKGITGDSGANISVLNVSASSESIVKDCDWTKLELYGKTDKKQKEIVIALRLGNYGSLAAGEAWFDEVKIEKLSKMPSAFSNFYKEEKTETPVNPEHLPYLTDIICWAIICALAAASVYILLCRKERTFKRDSLGRLRIVILLLVGLIIRILANYLFKSIKGTYGHSTDINCFQAWGEKVFNRGPANFYEEGYFADYPPGYMFVLGFCSFLRNALGVAPYSATHALIVKMPAILCDLLSGYLVYKIAIKQSLSQRTALLLSALIVFNPVFVFISGVWAQIDIVLSIFMALAFVWLAQGISKDNALDVILSGLFFGLAVAFKPQALMAGPIYAVAYLTYIVKYDRKTIAIRNTVLAAVLAFAVILIPAMAFTGTQKGFWIIDKYIGTATSYNYATIEAFNLMALLGGNWADINLSIANTGITFKQLGLAMMIIVVLFSIILYLLTDNKKKGTIFIVTAFLLSGMFTLGHYMHERYLFPVLLLIMLAMIYYKDRRLFLVFAGFTVTLLINSCAAFIICDAGHTRFTDYKTLMTVGSILTLIVFAYFTYVCIDLLIVKKGKAKQLCFKGKLVSCTDE